MSTVYDIVNTNRAQQAYQPQQQMPNMGMFNNLRQFAQTLSGDPMQMVQGLIQSGRMSQQQFNQLAQQATQIQQMFNLK